MCGSTSSCLSHGEWQEGGGMGGGRKCMCVYMYGVGSVP